MARTREFVCATRAVKNAEHLQMVAPHIMPAVEPPGGFGSVIPLETLFALHASGGWRAHGLDASLADQLTQVALPAVGQRPTGPLFNGTLYFVRVVFTVEARQNAVVSVSIADYETAVNYAKLAAVPISQYARQYGPNSVTINPRVIRLNVTLPAASGTNYNDADLRRWVNQVASAHRLPSSSCVVVLNPLDLNNTDGLRSKGVGGYHGKANIPYIFVNMGSQGITIADPTFGYAGILSHEIAETVVDPNADGSNPEVCDPCGPNCASTYLPYFELDGTYITTSQDFPPPFSYGFYINGIVTPEWALPCPVTVPASACEYAPTFRTAGSPGGSSARAFSAAVATRTDGRPFYTWWELGGGSHGWMELLDGLTDLPPAAALIGTDVHGNAVSPPYLFVMAKGRGDDRNLYLNQLSLGGAQVGWRRSAGLETDVAPGMASAGAFSVVVAKQHGTGQICYTWWELGGGARGWAELLGLLTDTPPAAALVATNTQGGAVSPPYLFVMAKGPGNDPNLYLNQLSLGQAQVGWQLIGPEYGS